jgi:hypothetical protein
VDLPRFTPAPRGKVPTWRDWKIGEGIDVNGEPRCRACPEPGPVDVESGLGLACWRVCVLAPAWEFRIALEAEPAIATKTPAASGDAK